MGLGNRWSSGRAGGEVWGGGLLQPGWAPRDGSELRPGWMVTCVGQGLPWGGIAWDTRVLIVILGLHLPLGRGVRWEGAVRIGRRETWWDRDGGPGWGTVLRGPEG